jgi:predicted component of type VI protein secretion system
MMPPRPTAVPSWSAPRLWIVTPEGAIATSVCIDLPLAMGEISLGRDATSTIRLPDPWMSRRHATISMRGGRLVLEDLASRWGTRLNDVPLTRPSLLVDGDAIVMGATAVVVEHSWHGGAIDRRLASAGREGSDDGLSLFDSTTRRLTSMAAAPRPRAAPRWERRLAVAATVLLSASAALLAWRLLAGW